MRSFPLILYSNNDNNTEPDKMRFTDDATRRCLLKEMALDPYGIKTAAPAMNHLIDIGANAGLVSILFRLLKPSATILAVEPDPKVFDCLIENVAGLDVVSMRKALGDGRDCGLVPRPERTCKCLQYEPGRHVNVVQSATLDRLIEDFRMDHSRTMLKVDCEGGERFLMGHGPSEALMRRMGRVSMELHSTSKTNTAEAYGKWLSGLLGDSHDITLTPNARERGRLALFRASLKVSATAC